MEKLLLLQKLKFSFSPFGFFFPYVQHFMMPFRSLSYSEKKGEPHQTCPSDSTFVLEGAPFRVVVPGG